MNKEQEVCCVTSCDQKINRDFWEERWQLNETGWDLQQASPTLTHYIDEIQDKSSKVLIPGCGNAYEAEYMLSKGFENISLIDIAPSATQILSSRFENNPQISIYCEDFFKFKGSYNYILEQTFFCAINPMERVRYVYQMHQLLAENGYLEGVLFNREFEISPPFGGSEAEYRELFGVAFEIEEMKTSPYSVEPRKDTELMIRFKKKSNLILKMYSFEGMHCESCRKKISDLFMQIDGIKQVLFSTNYSEFLIISERDINPSELEALIAYEPKYKISPL